MATIATRFSFKDEVSLALKKITENAQHTTKGFESLTGKIVGLNSAIGIFKSVSNIVNKATDASNEMIQRYQYQVEQELKLETIMKQRMGANNAMIDSIKQLASEQQKLGIYGDEMILQGAQELASFTSNEKALKTLIPAMNDLIAQQYGYSASGMDFQHTADMMGKVLSGQTGALSRMGYIFSEEEKQMLKTGNEMQRASVLAKIITDNVGHMNQALAGTQMGQIQRLSMTIGDLKEQVGQALMPFKQFFSIVTSKWKIAFYENLISALNFVQTHINGITIALGALVVGLGAVSVAFIAMSKQAIISALASAVEWAIANAPMLLTVGIILAIITALGLFLAFSQHTFSAVGGFIGGFVAVLQNMGKFVANIFIEIGNKIADFFINIFSTVVRMVTPLAGMIGKIFGQDWGSKLESFQAQINKFQQDRKNKETFQFEYTNVGETVQKGKDIGSGISDKFQAQIDKLTGGLKKAVKDGTAEGNLNKYASDGSLLTTDKSLVDVAEDYQELLSKKASEKFNINYSQIVPQVLIDKLDINNGSDLDEVTRAITEGIRNAQNSALY